MGRGGGSSEPSEPPLDPPLLADSGPAGFLSPNAAIDCIPSGPGHEMLVLIAYAQMPRIDTHAVVSRLG